MNSMRNSSLHPLVGWGIHNAAARLGTCNVFSLMERARPCCTICRSIHHTDINKTIVPHQFLSSKRFYHSIQKNNLQLITCLPSNQSKIAPYLRFRVRAKATVPSVSHTQSGTTQSNLTQDGPEQGLLDQSTDQVPSSQFAGSPDCEGPVMHHSSAAALVFTDNGISVSEAGTSNKETPGKQKQNSLDNTMPPQFVFIDNKSQNMSEEVLLSHTTAYIRRVSELGAVGVVPSIASSHQPRPDPDESGDVEYEVSGKKSSAPKGGLSGALPASAMDWRILGATKGTSELPGLYAALAKSRLTGLVVTTALGGYVLSPMPFSAVSVVGVCLGTGLISAAANTTNQILETPYDAQMKRTANRVLVKGLLTPLHAAGFAAVCGAGGVGMLLGACNPLTAVLGATNLLLYTSVYTPMKRKTIANTWMGAVVGAIPPLMGWCGSGAPLLGPDSYGAWLMAGLLFAWQFPHFNALSWNLRPDYSRAGYRMMCVTNPRLCKLTCVRYSLAMLAIGFAAPALGVTTWTFAMDSTPLNALMLYLSYRFYRDGDSTSSRNLFRFSLVHLPAVIVLMIISKKYTRDAAASSKQQDITGLTDVMSSSSSVGTVLASSSSEAASTYSSKVVYNKRLAAATQTEVTVAANTGTQQLSKDACVSGVSVAATGPASVTVAELPVDVTVLEDSATNECSVNASATNLIDDRLDNSNTVETIPSR